jgi:hypothetical protein
MRQECVVSGLRPLGQSLLSATVYQQEFGAGSCGSASRLGGMVEPAITAPARVMAIRDWYSGVTSPCSRKR